MPISIIQEEPILTAPLILRKLTLAAFLLPCLILSGSWSFAQEDSDEADTHADSQSDPVVQNPPAGKVPSALVNLAPSTNYAFVVDKELRTITLWKNSKVPSLVAAYPTDMGKNKGNKLYQGDHKTPEGIYFFLETYQQPYLDFSLYGKRAFTMDYPNFFDRMEKKTGGGIWLHAIPDTKSLTRGSRGCVVVRNDVIEKLKEYIELRRTPIIVQNKVSYITPTEWAKRKKGAESWLETWRKSWESKDLAAYIEHYDEDFKSSGMGFKQWRKFKESLNEKYSFIKIDVDNIDIFKNGDQYIFRFNQTYHSDKNQDFGEKYLYVLDRKDGEEELLKIVGEEWNPLKAKPTTTISASGSSPDKS